MTTTDWNFTGTPSEPGWYVVEANWLESRSPLVFAAEYRDGKLIDADCKIERWCGPHVSQEAAEAFAAQEIKDEQDADDIAGS